jgi:hypothetical protein
VSYVEETANAVLSTTAGTYTTVIQNASDIAIPLVSGRRYKHTFIGGSNLLVAGSGFATSDVWYLKLQVSTNSGSSWADVGSPSYIVRAQVAQSMRYAIPQFNRIYDPGADSTTTRFRWQATKASGAATVTSTLESGVNAPFGLMVEDVGLAL